MAALLLYHVITILSIGVTVYAASRWGRPRALYFICYTCAITIYAVGYLLEITAPTLEAAVVACKISYLGIPYIAPFGYLFARDYTGARIRSRRRVLALMAFPMLCTLLVLMWPNGSLYYRQLAFTGVGLVPHLVITPGILYHLAMLYSVLVLSAAFAYSLRHYLRAAAGMRRHLLVFLLAALLPILGCVLSVTSSGWDPQIITFVLNTFVLAVYMVRNRQRGWAVAVGRELAIQDMKEAFIMLDERGYFMDANAAAYSYFPALRHFAAGTAIHLVENFPPQLCDGAYSTVDFRLDISGELHYMRASRSRLELDTSSTGTSILIYDDSENHRLMTELEQLATHDTLTGLYNRGTFFKTVARDYDLARRKQNNASILMLDIDHFKAVNDKYGHPGGDKVLVAIADILRVRLRHTDLAGRYGGDELLVWLPDSTPEGAAAIADTIRLALERITFETDLGRFKATTSVGVAGMDYSREESFEDLLARADSALYRTKREGRNRVCLYLGPDGEDASALRGQAE